jgi:hypothetical protein
MISSSLKNQPQTHEGARFMRRRYQKGSLFKRGKTWVGQWRQDGHRPKRTLGLIAKMTKTEAQRELAKILEPLNSRDVPPSQSWVFADFMGRVYLPFYRRKWKRSTAMTTEDRLNHHLVSEFGGLTLGKFHRDPAAGILGSESRERLLVQHGGSFAPGPKTGVRYGSC